MVEYLCAERGDVGVAHPEAPSVSGGHLLLPLPQHYRSVAWPKGMTWQPGWYRLEDLPGSTFPAHWFDSHGLPICSLRCAFREKNIVLEMGYTRADREYSCPECATLRLPHDAVLTLLGLSR